MLLSESLHEHTNAWCDGRRHGTHGTDSTLSTSTTGLSVSRQRPFHKNGVLGVLGNGVRRARNRRPKGNIRLLSETVVTECRPVNGVPPCERGSILSGLTSACSLLCYRDLRCAPWVPHDTG
jgi:hypothetical protein